jgi:hypothetical protein
VYHTDLPQFTNNQMPLTNPRHFEIEAIKVKDKLTETNANDEILEEFV